MAFGSLLSEIRSGLGAVLEGMGEAGAEYSVGPARPGFGDASSNLAFILARRLGRPPGDVASEVAAAYEPGELVSGCEAHPSGYLNFAARWGRLAGLIVSESMGDGHGSPGGGVGGRVVVEHTSVNPNKALHIGHVRNVVIGDTVARILRRAGHEVTVLNYVDDSGLQVADIVLGFRRLGFAAEPPPGEKFDRYCGGKVYVAAAERCASDPALAEERRAVLREMEGGASETARFAGEVTRRVLACQLETCWRLGASYDCLNFESQIVGSGLWGRVFEDLKGRGLAEYEEGGKNAGCWVVRGGDGEDDKVLVRSNGTATYMAKDVPYAAWKLGLVGDPFGYEPYGGQPGSRRLWQTVLGGGGGGPPLPGERVITVIDSRQARLQRMVAQLMARLKSSPDAYVHLGYESVTLSPATASALGLETGGRGAQMSGRRGLYVGADEVCDALEARAAEETSKRHPGMPGDEVAAIARDVAVGALRYEMIRQDLDKVIAFDMAKSQSLDGDTAAYVQYAHARASRIIEKSARPAPAGADCSLLAEGPELALVREIGVFGERVGDAARNLSPKVVARYCHGLAVAFNAFYEKTHVLGIGDDGLEAARLLLVHSFRRTAREALGLLGIAAPDVM